MDNSINTIVINYDDISTSLEPINQTTPYNNNGSEFVKVAEDFMVAT